MKYEAGMIAEPVIQEEVMFFSWVESPGEEGVCMCGTTSCMVL